MVKLYKILLLLLTPFVVCTCINRKTLPQPQNTAIVVDSIECYLKELNFEISDTLKQTFDTWREKKKYLELHKDEFVEIKSHIIASLNDRFSSTQKNNNLINLINFKLNLEVNEYNKPVRQLSEMNQYNYYDSLFWKGQAQLKDSHKGSSNYLIILIGQKHAFYRTPKENEVVKNIQDNIYNIKELLYKNGVRLFSYEGTTLKQRNKEITTVIPNDKIIEVYEKKIEYDFEQKYSDIYSYGIEDISLHRKSSILLNYIFILHKYLNNFPNTFPIKSKDLSEQITSFIENNYDLVNSHNLDLDVQIFIDSLNNYFKNTVLIDSVEYKKFADKIEVDANNIMINARNEKFAENAEKLFLFTKEPIITMKIGVSHFENHPYFDSIGFELNSLQSILKEKDVSYVYVLPDTLSKYMNIEFKD